MNIHVILVAFGPVTPLATQVNEGFTVELHSMMLVGPDKMLGLPT